MVQHKPESAIIVGLSLCSSEKCVGRKLLAAPETHTHLPFLGTLATGLSPQYLQQSSRFLPLCLPPFIPCFSLLLSMCALIDHCLFHEMMLKLYQDSFCVVVDHHTGAYADQSQTPYTNNLHAIMHTSRFTFLQCFNKHGEGGGEGDVNRQKNEQWQQTTHAPILELV